MRIRHSVPFLLIGTIAAGACGAATVLAPRLTVSQAAENLGDLDRFAFTASFAGSDEDAIAFFSEGEDVSAEDRKNMLLFKHSQLSVAVDKGGAGADDDKMALDVKVGDIEDAVQVRVEGKKLYLRGDVAKLADLAGAPRSDLDKFQTDAAKMGFGFVGDALAGKWVTTDLAPLESFTKGLSGGGAPIPGIPSFDLGQIDKIMDTLGKAWKDVDVKRLGKEDAGDHLALSASARQLYTSIKPLLGEFGLPFGELPDASEVPDDTYTLDVWVSDEQINRAELDLAQFAPDYQGGRVALRVDLERRPDGISIPDGATSVDLLEIFGKFMTGLTSPFDGAEAGGEGGEESLEMPEGLDTDLMQQCMEAFSKATSPEDIDQGLMAKCSSAFGGED